MQFSLLYFLFKILFRTQDVTVHIMNCRNVQLRIRRSTRLLLHHLGALLLLVENL